MAKKSYNPLKMWGAWVGGVVAVILLLGLAFTAYGSGMSGGMSSFNVLTIIIAPVALLLDAIGLNEQSYGIIFLAIFQFVYGFLLGWGVHSLIRGLRK